MGCSLSSFSGNNAVIGCSEKLSFCDHRCHPYESYFSINFDREVDPDFLFNITKELPPEFKNRFHVTLVENLDWYAYNESSDPLSSRSNKNGKKGFNTGRYVL